MVNRLPPPPARAALFYSTSLFLLASFGSLLYKAFGLFGSVIHQSAFFLGLAILFGMVMRAQPLKETFQLRGMTGATLVKVILLGVAAWLLAQVLANISIQTVLALGGQVPQYYQSLTQAPFAVAMIVGAVLPSICEEFAFRGYVQSNLQSLGPKAAIWVTAVLFGVMHMTVIRLVPLVVLGLIFTVAVQRTRSIWSGVILHLMNNGLALAFAFFGRNLPAPTPEIQELTSQVPLGSWVTLAGAALFLGAVVWAMLRQLTPQGEAVSQEASPEPSYPHRIQWAGLWLFLIPGGLIYLLAAAGELMVVFGG